MAYAADIAQASVDETFIEFGRRATYNDQPEPVTIIVDLRDEDRGPMTADDRGTDHDRGAQDRDRDAGAWRPLHFQWPHGDRVGPTLARRSRGSCGRAR
jgi:hypothetical protein